MSPGVVVALVVGGVLFLLLGVMVPLVVRASRKSKELVAGIVAQAEANGEQVIIPPSKGSYEGSTDGAYGKVAGTGTLVLTDARLTFVKVTGGIVDVPAKSIVSARAEKSYNGLVRPGLLVVVVENPSSELLFAAPQSRAQWLAGFAKVVAK